MPASSIIEYLDEFGSKSLKRRPFCDVDALVLAQLCYFKFDGLIPHEGYVPLREIYVEGDTDAVLGDPKYAKQNRALFDRLVAGKRFGDLKLSHYVSVTDKELQTQFCAVTFLMPDGVSFVAYRGTDETLVGWKEDFNLTYMDEIPSQRMALKYLEEAAGLIDGDFYVGGHSKGGHLSIYAAMHAAWTIQDRLIRIYCMDGPGFMKSMLAVDGYARIRDRIVKLLPQSSLVGMLQQKDDTYTVIKSTGVGLLQHNLYTWKVERGQLVPEGELKDSARFVDSTINEWIESLDPESRRLFTDTLYDILASCDADNRVDFMADFTKNASQIRSTVRDMDEETIQMLKTIIGRLFDDAAQRFRSERRSK